MIGFTGISARAVATASILLAALAAAEAAGAFAVGSCGAYGYGYDFRKVTDARAAAVRKCSGEGCKVVGDLRRGCAAMAIERQEPLRLFRLGGQLASRQGGEYVAAPLL